MGGSKAPRTALLAGVMLAASLLGVSLAIAQDAPATESQIDFTDAVAAIRNGDGAALDLSVRDDPAQRFAPADRSVPDGPEMRRLEVELAAGGGDSPLDVSIAQRAALGADANGDLARQRSGSELRIGRGLVGQRAPGDASSSVYMFVASDDEALTWQPGARSAFGGQGSSVTLQDRVEVGDLSAGVTYERNGVQASLAYVEREESTRVGRQHFSQDQSFTGVTVTMRR